MKPWLKCNSKLEFCCIQSGENILPPRYSLQRAFYCGVTTDCVTFLKPSLSRKESVFSKRPCYSTQSGCSSKMTSRTSNRSEHGRPRNLSWCLTVAMLAWRSFRCVFACPIKKHNSTYLTEMEVRSETTVHTRPRGHYWKTYIRKQYDNDKV